MELNELGGVRDRGLEVQNNHPVIRQLYRGLSENITKYRTMNTICTTQPLPVDEVIKLLMKSPDKKI